MPDFSHLFADLLEESPQCPSIQHIVPYHPQRGGANPAFNQTDSLLLRLKGATQSNDLGIRHFLPLAQERIPDSVLVASVPSSDSSAQKMTEGIRLFVSTLCNGSRRIDGVWTLVRHKSIVAAHKGGNRDIQVHLGTIRVSVDAIRNTLFWTYLNSKLEALEIRDSGLRKAEISITNGRWKGKWEFNGLSSEQKEIFKQQFVRGQWEEIRSFIYSYPIWVLDDIKTTGSSLKACFKLLSEAGYTNIQLLALGETTN